MGPGVGPGAPPKKKSKTLLYVGGGCVGLLALCCLSGAGVVYYMKSSKESDARAQAETFLAAMQARNYPAAFGASVGADSGLYSVDRFTQCLTSTPLATMTSYDCSQGADSELTEVTVTVYCNVVTAAGPQDIAVFVNVYDFAKQAGFVWFRPGAPVGPLWHSDECASFSGKMYFQEPPDGFIRP